MHVVNNLDVEIVSVCPNGPAEWSHSGGGTRHLTLATVGFVVVVVLTVPFAL